MSAKTYPEQQIENKQLAKDQTAVTAANRTAQTTNQTTKAATILASDPVLAKIQVSHKPQYGGGPFGNGV